MEIDNANAQYLGSFGKEVFWNCYQKDLDFGLDKFYNTLKCIQISVVLNIVYAIFLHFIIHYIKYNPPKIIIQ